MDVQYTLTLRNDYQRADVCLAKLASVDLTDVQAERVNDFAVCSNAVAQVSPGVFTRTIIVRTTAAFDAAFPTDDNKRSTLSGAMLGAFSMQLAARVTETIVLNIPCP